MTIRRDINDALKSGLEKAQVATPTDGSETDNPSTEVFKGHSQEDWDIPEPDPMEIPEEE